MNHLRELQDLPMREGLFRVHVGIFVSGMISFAEAFALKWVVGWGTDERARETWL